MASFSQTFVTIGRNRSGMDAGEGLGLYEWGPTPWWLRVPVRLWRLIPEDYSRLRGGEDAEAE